MLKTIDVTVVRIYLTEESNVLSSLLKYLQKEARLHGVSVFRAIKGFGEHGEYHNSSLVDLSLNLPVVIEFFDHADKIGAVLEHLNTLIKPEHILSWQAQANMPTEIKPD